MQNTLTDDEERALISALPDKVAFQTLYRAYFERVFGYIAYRVGRRQDAEDITADVFMRVLRKVHTFEYRGAGSFAAWIFQIARNQVAQFYRYADRQPDSLIPLDALPHMQGDNLLPDEALMRKETFARLQGAIASLSERRQEVVTLRFYGGLSNQEIAHVLDLDERTVASHLSRAIDDLQRTYRAKESSL
ncbi:MAG: sigma-70 family RNA polymerase sigma factor [Chloroflexota bacterium]